VKIVTLEQARAEGLTRYFTGKPCKRGHVSERNVSSRACLICAAEGMKCLRAKDPEMSRAKANASQRKVRARNPKKHIDEVRVWQLANPEKRKVVMRRWKKVNPAKVKADRASRRARVRKQKCQCCKFQAFVDLYATATLFDYEVDHIIPLALGGAHCLKNLQLLTPEEHLAKSKVDIATIATARHARNKLIRETRWLEI
jgi:5-methylcytosine-specific restriction endonuclease McrA